MTVLKFRRNTHDAEGSYRAEVCETPESQRILREATFELHMGYSKKPMTFSELVTAHRNYDRDWPDEPYGYTVSQMLRGLADLVDAGLFEVVEAPDVGVQQV